VPEFCWNLIIGEDGYYRRCVKPHRHAGKCGDGAIRVQQCLGLIGWTPADHARCVKAMLHDGPCEGPARPIRFEGRLSA
jgi:hypothetical protein